MKIRRRNVPEAEIIRILKGTKGFLHMAAKKLGITHMGLDKKIRKSKRLQAAFHLINEAALDKSEVKLLELVEKLDLNAVIFYLKNKGRARGYVLSDKVLGILLIEILREGKQEEN